MKRSWLSLALICFIFGIIGINLYRETNSVLAHSLKLFQESLPAGTNFHYNHANINFLAQGLTLHDVTLKTQDTFFHAKTIRLGHPKTLPNGKLSLSSLLIKEASFHNEKLDFHLNHLKIRHLLIPADGKLPISTNLAVRSMHSLATLTSFDLSELANIRFELGACEGLEFNFHPISSNKILIIKYLKTDNIIAEGYGLGGHVRLRLNHFSLHFQFDPSILTASLKIPLLFNNPLYQHPVPYYLSFNNLEAHVGITQLLNHPFRKNFELSSHFWEDPVHIFWTEQGGLKLHMLTLSQGEPHRNSSFTLDSLLAERKKDGDILTTDALLTGFHLHLVDYLFRQAINGQNTTLRVTDHSQKEEGEWQSQVTSLLTLPDRGTIKTESHVSLPDEINKHLASQITAHNTELSLQGSALVKLLTSFFITSEQPLKNSTSVDNNPLFSHINALSTTRPLAAPLTDYLLKSENRILHINFGHISLETLQNIPFSGSDNAIFDSLHITNINTQTITPTP